MESPAARASAAAMRRQASRHKGELKQVASMPGSRCSISWAFHDCDERRISL
eukprot:CAMPEP_0202896446 /NCGR_PEP_ID=MMETSP1392-20130828/5457_1 /ASSEMBLY_ACC=CAM_ASM_000868 /TAXON_ID=225041 /ORGANISM="Chlamydomonas chlamydogama, Strain SAG 11-48b" /LENGTH=51 /DNA_ID=CAMNT_0049581811 /DNA_START=1182 /DNA_END=1334 /DNA_ORIENTATION=+